MDRKFAVLHANNADERTAAGFAAVYQSAFAEAPYFETYEIPWVLEHVWNAHQPHCIMVANLGNQVIGLGCAHTVLSTVSTIGEFLQSQNAADVPFPLETTLYMSELAVLRDFRGLGVGKALVQARIAWAREHGFTHYCMRTAAIGSNSRKLYESLGAKVAPIIQDVQGEAIESQSSQRIVLYDTL